MMKLVFTFSLANPSEGYTTAIDIADEVVQLPDARERVLALSQAIGDLTRANLTVTCVPLDLKNVRVKDAHIDQMDAIQQKDIATLLTEFAETVIAFNYKGRELAVRKLRIAAPIAAPVSSSPRSQRRSTNPRTKRSATFKDSLIRPDFNALDQYEGKQKAYYARFVPVIEHLLALLNAHPTHNEWQLQGISPRWYDETQQKQAAKRHKAVQHKVTKEITRENRRKELEEKRERNKPRPKSDASRETSDRDEDDD